MRGGRGEKWRKEAREEQGTEITCTKRKLERFTPRMKRRKVDAIGKVTEEEERDNRERE